MSSSSEKPSRYHSSMVNSGLCWRPRSAPRYTRQIWKISPLPAASSRFIAYSGDVCRNNTPSWPGTCTLTLPRFTSDTGVFTMAGVSTSSTFRAKKNSRAARSAWARRRNAAFEALGRQCPSSATGSAAWMPVAQRANAFAHAKRLARSHRAIPFGGAWRQQQDHGRAHVEARHFSAFGQRLRREHVSHGKGGDFAMLARRHVAMPNGGHAADVEGADQDDAKRRPVGVESAEHALVAREQAGYQLRRGPIHAEEASRHIKAFPQLAGERHVDAVIVVGRQVDSREGSAGEGSLPCAIAGEQRAQRVFVALGLQQPIGVDRA